jgi:hypothetical protein
MHGAEDVGLSGQVKNQIDATHRPRERISIAYVTVDNTNRTPWRVNMRRTPTVEIIEYRNGAATPLDQAVHQMTADKPGTACYEDGWL